MPGGEAHEPFHADVAAIAGLGEFEAPAQLDDPAVGYPLEVVLVAIGERGRAVFAYRREEIESATDEDLGSAQKFFEAKKDVDVSGIARGEVVVGGSSENDALEWHCIDVFALEGLQDLDEFGGVGGGVEDIALPCVAEAVFDGRRKRRASGSEARAGERKNAVLIGEGEEGLPTRDIMCQRMGQGGDAAGCVGCRGFADGAGQCVQRRAGRIHRRRGEGVICERRAWDCRHESGPFPK